MDSLAIEFDYLRYLEATMDEQFSLEDTINEYIGIYESATLDDRLQVFTEAVGEKMKSNWQKFKAWIKKVWAKFLEKLAHTFSNTQGYLEQYKDIILKKKVKEGFTVEIPNHQVGVKRIFEDRIEAISAQEVAAYADALLNTIIQGKIPENVDQIFKDKCKSFNSIDKILENAGIKDTDQISDLDYVRQTVNKYYLGGDPRSIPTTDPSLNMTDMYEWCHDFEKVKANIEKDNVTFDKNCDIIINAYETATKKAYDEYNNNYNKPKESETTQNNANDPAKQMEDEAKAQAAQAENIEQNANANTGGAK